jgi:hypothetical protein
LHPGYFLPTLLVIIIPLAGKRAIDYMNDSLSALEAENHEEILDNVILRRYIRRFTDTLNNKSKKDYNIMQ